MNISATNNLLTNLITFTSPFVLVHSVTFVAGTVVATRKIRAFLRTRAISSVALIDVCVTNTSQYEWQGTVSMVSDDWMDAYRSLLKETVGSLLTESLYFKLLSRRHSFRRRTFFWLAAVDGKKNSASLSPPNLCFSRRRRKIFDYADCLDIMFGQCEVIKFWARKAKSCTCLYMTL
jgi:hypothetical protein